MANSTSSKNTPAKKPAGGGTKSAGSAGKAGTSKPRASSSAPAAKKPAARKPAASSSSAKKPTRAAANSKSGGKGRSESGLGAQIVPFCLYIAALLVLLVLIPAASGDGIVISFLRRALFGLFSASAFAVPVLLVLLGVFWRSGGGGTRVGWQFYCSLAVAFVFSVTLHIVLSGEAVFDIPTLFNGGVDYSTGGVIGGFFGSVFLVCLGRVVSLILLIAALFVLCLLLFGLTPNAVYIAAKSRAAERREARAELAETEDGYEDEPEPETAAIVPAPAKEHGGRKKFDTDVDMSGDSHEDGELHGIPDLTPEGEEVADIDKKIFDEVMRRTRERYGEQSFEKGSSGSPELAEKNDNSAKAERHKKVERLEPVEKDADADGIDLSKIFVDPDAIALLKKRSAAPAFDESAREGEASREDILEAERQAVDDTVPDDGAGTLAPEAEAAVPVYEFPPLDLLAKPKAATEADIAELRETAQRLVDTLASFRVKTKISDIFHGPTITRYELTPEVGTRVSSIANLSDDIALNLAAESVRIEAPIPGKAAVGVEVPNRTRETVYLRQLFDTDEFRGAKSLLTAALGLDVAGQPIFCDISKMPHLLIAGTTGGGKSVCINCIIMSILYRTTPDQVRLIMIDPKQVEFVPYNGIPHLHVPVVSDMKKAAGTLGWAVGEMERRYEMIRDVGMKNIEGYNKVTNGDPEKPYMPYLVIFIDELADLMMTASDDVETPICRIAQKGRAAGVHIIIGTQRPSVDVVTGLIKANFPSRIALTSASQTDSRTILGTGGAEKLLGRGDMLYAPIGAPKPLRVQGAFVGEDEVEAVTEFLKGICPVPNYDEDAIDGIEEAARQCGNGKRGSREAAEEGGGGDGVFGDDPMMRQALELAVDSGKISTSLIQRRLSLGYGRAAKLIDRMEALGFVGPPDGSRPREVLISRQAFQELVLKEGSD